MKKILIGLAVVLAIVTGAIFALMSNLGAVVETVVEGVGSRVTATAVTLGRADVAPAKGRASLEKLAVANPEGFRTPNAFTVGEIEVELDPASVADTVVVIRQIVVAAPQVTYEFGANGTNIDIIRKNAEAFATALSSGSASSQPAQGEQGEQGEPSAKVIIENLIMKDGQVTVHSGLLANNDLTAALPLIHLKDIGKASGGANAAQVAEIVIAALTKAATKAASGIDPNVLTDKIDKTVEQIKTPDDAAKAVEGLKGLMGQ